VNCRSIALASEPCALPVKAFWGQPKDRRLALAVLRRTLELDVNFIDTADSYGPHVSEELIVEALFPYPNGAGHCHQGRVEQARPQSMDARRKSSSPACCRRMQLETASS
jgi:Aldo/keto reductase family